MPIRTQVLANCIQPAVQAIKIGESVLFRTTRQGIGLDIISVHA